jgi:hypothetical protein
MSAWPVVPKRARKHLAEHFFSSDNAGTRLSVGWLTLPMTRRSMKDDPQHWRQLAQAARATADELDDPDAKRTMLEIAEGYEQMAVLTERRVAAKARE